MRLVFIGGMPRSGTTLVYGAVCACKGVNDQFEEVPVLEVVLNHFSWCYTNYEALGRDFWSSKRDVKAFFGSYVRAFLSHLKERYSDREVLALKRPLLAGFFPMMDEFLYGEDVRYVVVVRDPRDIFASFARVAGHMQKNRQPWEQVPPRDAEKWSEVLRFIYGPYLNGGESDRCFLIQYEMLVQQPETILKGLGKFLGLPIEAENVWGKSAPFLDRLRTAWKSDLWGKPITADRVGSYREALSTEEAATIEECCADYMQRFGYGRSIQ